MDTLAQPVEDQTRNPGVLDSVLAVDKESSPNFCRPVTKSSCSYNFRTFFEIC